MLAEVGRSRFGCSDALIWPFVRTHLVGTLGRRPTGDSIWSPNAMTARLLRAGASLAQHRGLPSRDRCLHRRRDDAHLFAAWLRPP